MPITRKRRYDPIKIDRLLKSKTIANLLQKVDSLGKINRELESILPDAIKFSCQALNLKNGILTIGVNQPAAGHQLYYQQVEILQRLNRALGSRITHLKIKTTSA